MIDGHIVLGTKVQKNICLTHKCLKPDQHDSSPQQLLKMNFCLLSKFVVHTKPQQNAYTTM